ncbi:MAG: FHA domain-containing protein [Verrucomicrobia bacterium]|nr:FHA domain-containing protein [Verrucomicrobiota bacterium]
MTTHTEIIPPERSRPPGRKLNAPPVFGAFLLDSEGQKIPIPDSCLLGRSPASDIVLQDSQVSGRHVLIHRQEKNEYMLVDLGSSNGTFVDGRHVSMPVRLRDKQSFRIAHLQFTFCQPSADPVRKGTSRHTAPTDRKVTTTVCWLLLLDIINSTELARSIPAGQLPLVFGGWFSECRQFIHDQGGTVDKFLGDALFAFWQDETGTPAQVQRTLELLSAKQARANPPFRWVLHHGLVSVGGTPGGGTERIMGEEVHFIFRLEKLAGSLTVPQLLSETAATKLRPANPLRELGRYPCRGFKGDFKVFSFAAKS